MAKVLGRLGWVGVQCPVPEGLRAEAAGWASAKTNKSLENFKVLQSFKVLKVRSPSLNYFKDFLFL